MAADYLLAGSRTAGSLPDSLREPGRRRRWQQSLQMRPAKLRVLGADDAGRARGFPPEDAFAPRRLRRACQREQRASLNMDGRRMGTQDRGPIRLAWRTVESAAQKGTKMSAEITME